MENPDTHSEKELLLRMAEGDALAFKIIYEKYWADLYQDAYRRLGSLQLSEDAVQEVFLRLWARRQQLQVQNLAGYLHQSVRNEVLDRLTRSTGPSHFYELFDTLLLENDTPETVLRDKELLGLVTRYAATLPAKRREIFLLHIETRLDTRQIAERLQISQKTVQNQLGTAMNGLLEQLRLLLLVIIAGRF